MRPPAPSPDAVKGLSGFLSLLKDEDFRAIVICGRPNSGKSEIVSGFSRANAAVRGKSQIKGRKSQQETLLTVGGTEHGTVWYEIPNTDRDLVFLDPSGEFFRRLSPDEQARLGVDITEAHFDFVRDAMKFTSGILLVVDVSEPDNTDIPEAPWRYQERMLSFTLAALRWLRFDKKAVLPALGVVDNIAARVRKVRRLDVPVLVLLSKVDRVPNYTNESPLDFSRKWLPQLHASLLTHTRIFHIDYCHTMIGPRDAARAEERPCGVLLSLEWLMAPPLRLLPRIPSRWLERWK
ncbi:MAG: GTPase domain-containing protein [Acidobacteriota bacterium]